MFKKISIILLSFLCVVIFVACGNEKSSKNTESSNKIKVNEELAFQNFKVTVNEVNVYEKDGKNYIDLPIKWLNQSFEDKTTFLAATSMDVKQGEKLLNEANGAWSDKQSDVYSTNAVGGEWKVKLTYELTNLDDDVDVTFVPTSGEESQSITIKIK